MLVGRLVPTRAPFHGRPVYVSLYWISIVKPGHPLWQLDGQRITDFAGPFEEWEAPQTEQRARAAVAVQQAPPTARVTDVEDRSYGRTS